MWIVALLVVLSCGERVVAQVKPPSPHPLTGTVLDPSSAEIAGAKVELESGKTVVAATTTNGSGSFSFTSMPVGTYQLVVHSPGFRDFSQDVVVSLKPRAALRIVLVIALVTQVVAVHGESEAPEVSAENAANLNNNTVTRDALDRVPVFDQDYITLLARLLSEDSIGTNGVSLVVDGVEANGPGVSPSAVTEVRINQNPYSAQFARPGRARLEIITKAGTPQFHGSINFLTRNSVFDAANFFSATKPSESRYYTEGSLTGPLGGGKANTFLLSAEQDSDNVESIVHAVAPDGSFIDDNVPSPVRHFFGSIRAYHDFANGDQFWVAYSFEQETLQNQGVGGTVLREAGFRSGSSEQEINVSYRKILSPHWVNQLRFLVGHNDDRVASNLEAPQTIVEGYFTSGGAQADSRRTEAHFDGTDFLTYAKGRHVLIFGADTPDLSRRGADDFSFRQGAYTFADITSYNHLAPSNFRIQTGNGHLVFWERNVSGFVEDTFRVTPSLSLSAGLRYYFQNYFHNDPDNFAPRLGFAFAPSTKSKTVFRGGAGYFYDRSGPRAIADLLHFDGRNLERLFLPLATGGTVPFPVTPADLTGVPQSLVALNQNTRIPQILQYSAGVEQQLTPKSTLSITYVGTRGMHLFRSVDANAPLSANYLHRPNPALGQVRSIESEGYQKGNSLEFTFRGKVSRYFSGQAQYVLSKTYNNTAGIPYFVGNSNFPQRDWARSSNDRRHKFDLLGSFSPAELWSLGVALQAYSGKPVNVTTGADANGDGVFNDRPAGGFAPRNSLPGPAYLGLDANVEREFLLGKDSANHRKLTAALNVFNLLNHPNFLTYNGVIGPDPANPIPSFGTPSAAEPGRRLQLNLQYKF